MQIIRIILDTLNMRILKDDRGQNVAYTDGVLMNLKDHHVYERFIAYRLIQRIIKNEENGVACSLHTLLNGFFGTSRYQLCNEKITEDEAMASKIAGILFNMNHPASNSGWSPLIQIRWDNLCGDKKYGKDNLCEAVKNFMEDGERKIELKTTSAGRVFHRLRCEFEWVASQVFYNENRVLPCLINEKSFSKDNSDKYNCIVLIDKVFSKYDNLCDFESYLGGRHETSVIKNHLEERYLNYLAFFRACIENNYIAGKMSDNDKKQLLKELEKRNIKKEV